MRWRLPKQMGTYTWPVLGGKSSYEENRSATSPSLANFCKTSKSKNEESANFLFPVNSNFIISAFPIEDFSSPSPHIFVILIWTWKMRTEKKVNQIIYPSVVKRYCAVRKVKGRCSSRQPGSQRLLASPVCQWHKKPRSSSSIQQNTIETAGWNWTRRSNIWQFLVEVHKICMNEIISEDETRCCGATVSKAPNYVPSGYSWFFVKFQSNAVFNQSWNKLLVGLGAEGCRMRTPKESNEIIIIIPIWST